MKKISRRFMTLQAGQKQSLDTALETLLDDRKLKVIRIKRTTVNQKLYGIKKKVPIHVAVIEYEIKEQTSIIRCENCTYQWETRSGVKDPLCPSCKKRTYKIKRDEYEKKIKAKETP